MSSKSTHCRRHLWLTLSITAAMLAPLPWLRSYQRAWLAQQCADELATAPDALLAGPLRRAAQLEAPGLAVLVHALGSSRESVAQGARIVLLEELSRWELLPRNTSTKNVVALSAELSQQMGKFSPARRAAAGDLVRRILDWPDFPRLEQSAQVAAQCEQMLRAAGTQTAQRDPAPAIVANGRAGIVPVGHWHDSPAARPVADLSGNLQPAELPGGGSPHELATDPSPLATTGIVSPNNIPPGRLPLDMGDARPLPRPDQQQQSNSAANQPAMLDSQTQSVGGARGGLEADALRGSAFDLIPELNSRDPARVRQAEDAMTRQGFTPQHLQLARRLADPDPAIRARWTAALPQISQLDAKPWLLWLSRDADAEVRLAALSLMATTGDPDLVRKAIQISRADSDARVQRVAEQLSAARR